MFSLLSLVRVIQQLNFYAFRKIKYVDTIRIDPKLEAETANYWRFRHEKFQRGKPELLGEIKRMNGQKQQQKSREKETTSANNLSEKENTALKSEVSSLKQRIEAMTKNIDELTSMVQKVTLVAQQPPQQQQEQEAVNSNNKRTKVEEAKPLSPILPDKAVSSVPAQTSATPMDMEVYPMPPSIPSPMRVNERTATTSSELSDEGFVDQLFTAFKTEDFDFDESESLPPVERETNHPRPELMGRLSDALSVLPRDIQEMIVERLIQAITSPKEIQDSIATVNTLKETTIAVPRGGGKALPSAVPQLPRTQAEQPQQVPQMGLNLAAATLAALLQQFGDAKTPEAVAAAAGKETHKSLLIPVHA